MIPILTRRVRNATPGDAPFVQSTPLTFNLALSFIFSSMSVLKNIICPGLQCPILASQHDDIDD
jgi:hypothetical protein